MSLRDVLNKGSKLKEWGKLYLRARFPEQKVKVFIDHNRKKYGRTVRANSDKAVLVGMDENAASTYCNSLVSTFLAQRTSARIDGFDFHNRRNPINEAIYASFGARRVLGLEDAAPFEEKSRKFAQEAMAGLKSKWDVYNLQIEGFQIGDLIYDTYQRQFRRETVRLDDPHLEQMIFASAQCYYATRAYFAKTKAVAVILWRTAHYKYGIVARMAFDLGIPVYLLPYGFDARRAGSFYMMRLDPSLSLGMRNPTKRFPYYRYREIYNKLSPEEQQQGRARGREHLAQRLSGKPDATVLVGRSAYDDPTGNRILSDTPKPKILIMLHDFCDVVHSFRKMLFPDFYEWARYTFEHASQTDFEWYAKPHPNSATWDDKNILNAETVARLSAEFPKIRILNPDVSNRQLLAEGLSAAFMVHGTAGHEFAAKGVPVINAGDNLHVDFNFNLNPATVEEYASCIARAGNLNHTIDPEEVEAFYYMHYFYFREKNASEVNPIEEGWRSASKADPNGAFGYFVKSETPEKQAKLEKYMEQCFTKPPERLTVTGL